MRPARTPVGLQLTQASRAISRAFGDALAAAGGSLPGWLILVNLKARTVASQRELADAVGIREATMTHHLTAMETAGLVSRRREQANRRVQLVELTPEGEAAFARLRDVAMSFDSALRRGISGPEIAQLEDVLARMAANVAGGTDTPRAG
jgi:MarR family transcriptional regulator, transcriptional regulator for hemolysin